MIYIGIDPGVSGGIACLDTFGHVISADKMPATDRDVLTLLQGWTDEDGTPWASNGFCPCRAVLERVSAGLFGKAGRMGVTSAFTFGRGVGALKMALTAAAIPFDEPTPQTWQKAMGVIYPKGSTPVERKNISKRRAQQLFPALTITHAIADSLLLAEYCRRFHCGPLSSTRPATRRGGSLRVSLAELRAQYADPALLSRRR